VAGSAEETHCYACDMACVCRLRTCLRGLEVDIRLPHNASCASIDASGERLVRVRAWPPLDTVRAPWPCLQGRVWLCVGARRNFKIATA